MQVFHDIVELFYYSINSILIFVLVNVYLNGDFVVYIL